MQQEILHIYRIILERAGSIQEHKSILSDGIIAYYPVQQDAMAVITFFIDQDTIRYLREEDAWL